MGFRLFVVLRHATRGTERSVVLQSLKTNRILNTFKVSASNSLSTIVRLRHLHADIKETLSQLAVVKLWGLEIACSAGLNLAHRLVHYSPEKS